MAEPTSVRHPLHEVVFEFGGALVAENTWPPQPDRDLPHMARIVQGHAEQARRSVPPPGEDAYRRQRRQLDRSAEIFVNEQARQTGPDRPVYLEASIGMPSEQRRTDIDAPEPVELPLPGGGAVRVRARIARSPGQSCSISLHGLVSPVTATRTEPN